MRAQPKSNIPPVPKTFMAWLEKNFNDTDKIDTTAEYDRNITQAENKTIFLKKFKTLIKPVEEKLTKAQNKEKMTESLRVVNTNTLEDMFGIKIVRA